ncbi:MAG: alkaline phosphatase family protein, partial [bacterium]
GLDCAPPAIVFEPKFADRFKNIRKLMNGGMWGPLRSITPPITVPAWACMTTGKDPGTLGIYGIRNRKDHTYAGLEIAHSGYVKEKSVWDIFGEAGHQVILMGVPPSFPTKPVNGCLISCFLTPDAKSNYTHPASLKPEIQALVGDYPFDAKGFRTDNKKALLQQLYDMAETHFKVMKYLLTTKPWDFFMSVEMATDRLHHGFWKYFDAAHRDYVPGNEFEGAIPDFYAFLDDKIGELLPLFDETTTVMIVSDHGAQRLDGGICINEWLIQQGFLALKKRPDGIIRFSVDGVDWSKTRVWGEGGYYGRVFLNVAGREPAGIVKSSEVESLLKVIGRAIEAVPDDAGRPLKTRAYQPEDLYQAVRGVPPDLIVIFDDLYWRSVGSVGYPSIWTHENDTGPDDCNHAMDGIFIAAGPGASVSGETHGLAIQSVAGFVLDALKVSRSTP